LGLRFHRGCHSTGKKVRHGILRRTSAPSYTIPFPDDLPHPRPLAVGTDSGLLSREPPPKERRGDSLRRRRGDSLRTSL